MKKYFLSLLILPLFLISCLQDSDQDLPSVEERVSKAREDLLDELTRPANGWRVAYRPTTQSGTFLLILDFDRNGTVRILSDVAENDGEFYDQTTTFRIDNGIATELIFESYSVLHFLFEKNQSTFGAEFEFFFLNQEDNNLVFESKSDALLPSRIVFEPASPSDASLISLGLIDNLSLLDSIQPTLITAFGEDIPASKTHLYLEDLDIAVYLALNLEKRFLVADVAGKGSDLSQFGANRVNLGITTGYTFIQDAIIFDNPINFTVDGTFVSINSLSFESTTEDGGPSFCPNVTQTTPLYTGSSEGLGNFTMVKSLFSSSGESFIPDSEDIYAVNIPFIFNANLESLYDEGSINEFLPNALGFFFFYGFEADSFPAYATGFILEDSSENSYFLLREFEPTTTIGNRISIQFTDNISIIGDGTPGINEENYLIQILDEIFEGGEIYAFDLPLEGLELYDLYNPCNDYEFLLVH